MRVLLIVQGLDIGRAYGGAERAGVELACRLKRDGLDVIVCAFWRCDTPSEAHWLKRLADDQIESFFASPRTQTQSPREFARALRHIAHRLGQRRVDIVHAHHDGGALAGLLLKFMWRARAALRTTYVPLKHEWGHTAFGWLCRQLFSFGLFPLLLSAEVAVSPAYAEALERRLLARWLRKSPYLIYNTVPLEAYQRSPQSLVADACNGHLTIGSVGRLTAQKGQRYLIEAAPRVLDAFPDARFLLVGDGELRAELQAQAVRLGVQKHFIFAGQHDNPAAYFQQMDLFVLPSLWEGVPIVALESIASGVPVVATDIPGTRELIKSGHSGWLVPPQDSRALADAIIAALRDPAKALEYTRRAKCILPEFGMDTIAGKYIELYRKLLSA